MLVREEKRAAALKRDAYQARRPAPPRARKPPARAARRAQAPAGVRRSRRGADGWALIPTPIHAQSLSPLPFTPPLPPLPHLSPICLLALPAKVRPTDAPGRGQSERPDSERKRTACRWRAGGGRIPCGANLPQLAAA